MIMQAFHTVRIKLPERSLLVCQYLSEITLHGICQIDKLLIICMICRKTFPVLQNDLIEMLRDLFKSSSSMEANFFLLLLQIDHIILDQHLKNHNEELMHAALCGYNFSSLPRHVFRKLPSSINSSSSPLR